LANIWQWLFGWCYYLFIINVLNILLLWTLLSFIVYINFLIILQRHYPFIFDVSNRSLCLGGHLNSGYPFSNWSRTQVIGKKRHKHLRGRGRHFLRERYTQRHLIDCCNSNALELCLLIYFISESSVFNISFADIFRHWKIQLKQYGTHLLWSLCDKKQLITLSEWCQ